MRHHLKALLASTSLALGACLLVGCTTQAWYEGMNQKTINDCNSLAPGERETCLAKVNRQNYERYEKEREAASKSNP